jgi:hypothetical protein
VIVAFQPGLGSAAERARARQTAIDVVRGQGELFFDLPTLLHEFRNLEGTPNRQIGHHLGGSDARSRTQQPFDTEMEQRKGEDKEKNRRL